MSSSKSEIVQPLIESTVEQGNHTSPLFRKYLCASRLVVFLLDITFVLWGIDIGFYGNEILTFNFSVADALDISYFGCFMLGCILYILLYKCVPEQIAFPLCYLNYIGSIVVYFINKQSTVLSRALQGLSLGVLFPWTLHIKFDLTTTANRFQNSFLTVVMLTGCFFIGYLIRLIGGSLERFVICGVSLLLSLLGLLMVFSIPTPSRILLKDSKKSRDQESDSALYDVNDELLSNLSQIFEGFFPNDAEVLLDSFLTLYTIERSILRHGWRTFISSSSSSFSLWIMSLLSIGFFPILSMSQSLPLLLRRTVPFLSDGFYCDFAVFTASLVVLIIGFFCVSVKRNRSMHFVGLLVLAVSFCSATILCVFDYADGFTTIVNPIKAFFLFVALVTFISIHLPLILVRLIGSFRILSRERYVGTFTLLTFCLVTVNYPLYNVFANLVHSSLLTYAGPAVIFVVFLFLFKKLVNDETSAEVIDKMLSYALCLVF